MSNIAGFAPSWYYDQQSAGLAIWIATGSINGVTYNGQAVSVPANSTTSISIGPNGQIIFGVGAGSYPVAQVVSGPVQTSGTPNTLPVFSPGILSVTDIRPSGSFSF